MQRLPESSESVASALSGVLVAGQDLLIDHIDLGVLQLRGYLERKARSVSLILLGSLILAGALLASDIALVDLLDAHGVSHATSLLTLAIPNAVLGAGLLISGLRLRA